MEIINEVLAENNNYLIHPTTELNLQNLALLGIALITQIAH